MGAKNMRVKLPHLNKAVQRARQIVTWDTDPMHENTIKAPSVSKLAYLMLLGSSVGQLSRVNNKKGMKVLCREKNGHYRNYITNVVYKEFSIDVRYLFYFVFDTNFHFKFTF